MKPTIAILFFSLMPLFASAQAEWINVANNENSKWDVKAGSLETSKTKAGTPIAVVIGRISNSSTKLIDLYKWYVTLADCANGSGKVVTLGVDGQYKFENDFVNTSGNIASAMAESICGAYQYGVNEREKKGI